MQKYSILLKNQIIKSEKDFMIRNPKVDLIKVASEKIFSKLFNDIKNLKSIFICGPGNNGLDGFNTYKIAKKKKYNVDFINLASIDSKTKIKIFENKLASSDVIIDSIFGIGLNRKIEKKIEILIEKINRTKKKIISIDIPSGIYCDSGKVNSIAIKASKTLVIGFLKPCCFLLPAKYLFGEIVFLGLRLLIPQEVHPRIRLINKEEVSYFLPKFDESIHKYNKGNVLILGGEMAGAARIVALAARKVGAGLSTINVQNQNLKFYCGVEPGTIVSIKKNINYKKFDVLVIGPGLGMNYSKKKIIEVLKNCHLPTILDADGISVFKNNRDDLLRSLRKKNNCILTPHEGEFKKIFEFDSGNKIQSVLKAAETSSSCILLKGNDTIIGFPNGELYINNNANSNLATAGSGDLLAGIISGLIAQIKDIKKASILSVYIHGMLSYNNNNVTVEDFLSETPKAINSLKNN